MTMLSAITGLLNLAPAFAGLLGGSKAAEVTQAAADIARSVTGRDDDAGALQALEDDGELLTKYQRQTQDRALAFYAQETARLEAVNQTIRIEAASQDPYVRRMRPTFGYIVAISWAGLMGGIVYNIVRDPATAGTVIGAVGQLATMWSVALSVLGVYVYRRSSEKVGAGQPGMADIVKTLARR